MVIYPLKGEDRHLVLCKQAKVECLCHIFIIEKAVRAGPSTDARFQQTCLASLEAMSHWRDQAREVAAAASADLRSRHDRWATRLEQAEIDAGSILDTLTTLLAYQRICDISRSLAHAGSFFATVRLLTHQFFWIYSNLIEDVHRERMKEIVRVLSGVSRCGASLGGWHIRHQPAARSRSQNRRGFSVSSGSPTSFQDRRKVASTGR